MSLARRMKASIHLFYGIIIGVLATLCMGSLKTDKAEFKQETVALLGKWPQMETTLQALKKKGWTIIDIEVEGGHYIAHIGR